MKKILLIIIAMIISIASFAHIPLMGHRGGVWGVQNTSGAFTEGAKYFDGLETDVKATKDGVLICCHDASLSNFYKDAARTTKWTSSETSFSSHTWAELRTKRYYEYNTWTKQTYEDTICTFGQYLDICRDNHVIALVELKWTEGYFTTATTAGMQKLMDEIEAHGMLNHCIIFTSMTNCLEWVRQYPKYNHIRVQFLGMTGNEEWYIRNLTAWAKLHHGDIAPECYQIDNAANISDALTNNVGVACWNITTQTSYKKYKGYGVNVYMTTDSLRPKFLDDYTPRTGFVDVEYKFLPRVFPLDNEEPVVDPQPEDEGDTTLNCNPYAWQNKGEMFLAFINDFNTAKSKSLDVVKKENNQVYYNTASGWQLCFAVDSVLKEQKTVDITFNGVNTFDYDLYLYDFVNYTITQISDETIIIELPKSGEYRYYINAQHKGHIPTPIVEVNFEQLKTNGTKVYDMLGRLIYENSINNIEYIKNNLKHGVYIVIDNNGNKKIIKK